MTTRRKINMARIAALDRVQRIRDTFEVSYGNNQYGQYEKFPDPSEQPQQSGGLQSGGRIRTGRIARTEPGK